MLVYHISMNKDGKLDVVYAFNYSKLKNLHKYYGKQDQLMDKIKTSIVDFLAKIQWPENDGKIPYRFGNKDDQMVAARRTPLSGSVAHGQSCQQAQVMLIIDLKFTGSFDKAIEDALRNFTNKDLTAEYCMLVLFPILSYYFYDSWKIALFFGLLTFGVYANIQEVNDARNQIKMLKKD